MQKENALIGLLKVDGYFEGIEFSRIVSYHLAKVKYISKAKLELKNILMLKQIDKTTWTDFCFAYFVTC